ncbi:MAG TPA: hypothetical protein VFC17_12510 [Candidatus Limnocylindrales bacterium]|nr:hypothetical protein [Candidatus Limnocylindrales bacterium]
MQTQTTTIKVVLSTSTYALFAERAKAEGVEPAHYCSILLTDYFVNDSKNIPSSSAAKKYVPPLNDIETIDVPRKLPSTIEQIFSVCNCVWREKMEFADALRKVAQKFKVGETTVRDKCTRRISLPHSQIDTDRFVQMLNQPASLRDYLCHRFPKFSGEIIQRFKSVMPPNFGAN